jgi:hypothetical protein
VGQNKIRPSILKDVPSIRALELTNKHTRFSFKHLDLAHTAFTVTHRDSDYFCCVLGQLKELSRFPAAELRANHSKAVRCHPITWKETSQPGGFTHLNKQLRDIDAWQFQIEKNTYGRIHGLFLDDVFFVIWLDPEHKLYPQKK